jgi:hypothetical protein
MAALAADIDSNTVIYGDGESRRRWEGKMAVTTAAPAAARADRGAYYAKGGGVAAPAAEDIVGGIESGAMSVDSIDTAKLPEPMRAKPKAEIAADLKQRAEKRQAAQKEIAELTKKRDEYIKANKKDDSGFDSVVKSTIEAQLK